MMKHKKRDKRKPGNPAGAGTEAIKIYSNGKLTSSFILTAENPQMIYYTELHSIPAEADEDTPADQLEAAAVERMIRYILNSGYNLINELAAIDHEAAVNLYFDILESLAAESKPGEIKIRNL